MDIPLSPSEKRVLDTLIDLAGQNGQCQCSIAELAEATNVKVNTVTTVISRLIKKMKIEKGGRRYGIKTTYRIREPGDCEVFGNGIAGMPKKPVNSGRRGYRAAENRRMPAHRMPIRSGTPAYLPLSDCALRICVAEGYLEKMIEAHRIPCIIGEGNHTLGIRLYHLRSLVNLRAEIGDKWKNSGLITASADALLDAMAGRKFSTTEPVADLGEEVADESVEAGRTER